MRYVKLMPTKQYPLNKLNINGIYYQESARNKELVVSYYVFYKNGMILDGGDGRIDKNDLFFKKLLDTSYLNHLKSIIYAWGIYNINYPKIIIEKYYAPSGGKIKTKYIEGKILNDTTIVFYRISSDYLDEIFSIQDTFHFREFSPKPKSTNEFIK